MKVRAAVALEGRRTEVREFDVPALAPDGGLLKIEAAGVCGADWPYFLNYPKAKGPLILGHENVGFIAEIGKAAAQRWGVKEGDRVALEEYPAVRRDRHPARQRRALRLHADQRRAFSLGWLQSVPIPAPERGLPQGSGARAGRAGGAGPAARQRRGVDGSARRRRHRSDGRDPGARPAGACLRDRGEGSRGELHHHQRSRARRSPARAGEGIRRPLHARHRAAGFGRDG